MLDEKLNIHIWTMFYTLTSISYKILIAYESLMFFVINCARFVPLSVSGLCQVSFKCHLLDFIRDWIFKNCNVLQVDEENTVVLMIGGFALVVVGIEHSKTNKRRYKIFFRLLQLMWYLWARSVMQKSHSQWHLILP